MRNVKYSYKYRTFNFVLVNLIFTIHTRYVVRTITDFIITGTQASSGFIQFVDHIKQYISNSFQDVKVHLIISYTKFKMQVGPVAEWLTAKYYIACLTVLKLGYLSCYGMWQNTQTQVSLVLTYYVVRDLPASLSILITLPIWVIDLLCNIVFKKDGPMSFTIEWTCLLRLCLV